MKPLRFLLALLTLPVLLLAQDPVLFQAFYWDVPANGEWWDTLRLKAPDLQNLQVDMVWFPPPFKGNSGAYDMGYGIYDHFDAGEFNQKGSVETRFGSRVELEQAIAAYHNRGMEVICDVVWNHTMGGDAEYNSYVQDYIKNKAWYPLYPYDHYLYVFANAPAGRYYVQVSGNKNDHSQTSYDDRVGYYAIRPWFSTSSGNNADGQAHWYEWNIGDGDSGPFDAFRIDLPGRVMEGNIAAVGDVDEYYIDHTGGWLEFKIWSTDGGGERDFIIPQLWYDPDTTVAGDDYDVSDSLKIYSYTRITPASGRFPKDYRNYHPTAATGGHDDIFENYHYPYFGNDLCYGYAPTLDSLKAWGQWLTTTLGFDGYRFDAAKYIDPYYLAQWINTSEMSNRYYVAEHWSSASEIQTWVDQINSYITGSRKMTAFDFPLYYALQSFCDDPNYDARNLHNAGLYPLWGSGYYITTFASNHDVFRPYTSAHNPIINNIELAYAYILTHPGTATIFYPDYFGGTFYNSDSTESFTMTGVPQDIEVLMRIRKKFVSGNFHKLTEVGNPDYKPGNDRYASGDYSGYAPYIYVAQREGSGQNGNEGGCIVVLNKHQTDTIGVWVTVQGNGVGASLLRDQSGHVSGTTEIYADNRVFVWAPPREYTVWADANFDLSLPVTLLEFSARVVPENRVRLQWQTGSEWQVEGFVIWRQVNDLPWQRRTVREIPARNAVQGARYVWEDPLPPEARRVRYRLEVQNSDGSREVLDSLTVVLNNQSTLPDRFYLRPAYPNPFNPVTTITFELPEAAPVVLTVYNALGQRIRVLKQGDYPAGIHAIRWKANDLPAGKYYIEMRVPERYRRAIAVTLIR